MNESIINGHGSWLMAQGWQGGPGAADRFDFIGISYYGIELILFLELFSITWRTQKSKHVFRNP